MLKINDQNKTVYVHRHKHVSGPSRYARVRMSSEKGPKHVCAQKHINSITIITLEGIEKIKTQKNDNKTV